MELLPEQLTVLKLASEPRGIPGDHPEVSLEVLQSLEYLELIAPRMENGPPAIFRITDAGNEALAAAESTKVAVPKPKAKKKS